MSRLPAVQEENSHAPATPKPGQQEDKIATSSSVSAATDTPSTVPLSTPDILGSLSFDDQQEGQVEILTPAAKDEVKKQLKYDTPIRAVMAARESRIASMEVSAEGVVSQISQDEDADILLGASTKHSFLQRNEENKVRAHVDTATVSTTSSSQHLATESKSTSSQSLTPPRTSLAPKPNSSPLFMKVSEEQSEQEEESAEPSPDRSHLSIAAQHIAAAAGAAAAAVAAGSPSYEEEEEDTVGALAHEVPPARTISLETGRLNLVSPLTMHPVTAKEHHHQSLEHQHSQDGTDEDTWEAEDTITDTMADNTYDSAKDWTKGYDESNPLHQMERKMQQVAQSLMDTLQCTPDQVQKVTDNPIQGTMSMFYDTVCKPEDVDENPRRPYFNEDFAQRFVKRMLTSGMSLLYLQPPHTTSNPSEDWKGRTVVMKIVPGSTGTQDAIQPKLQWTTMPGGTVTKAYMTSISLLRIHSVLTANQNLVPEESTTVDLEDDELCFISITSAAGKVFLFEANSVRERDEIANGLRNVIARLSFHLVAGDHQASTELYNDDRAIQEETEPGDLPALANPKLNMNRMTHLLMEA